MKGQVQLYWVCLVLFQETSKGQVLLDICENGNEAVRCSQPQKEIACCKDLKRFLGKRCLSDRKCNLEECPLRYLFWGLCDNHIVSFWENFKISCSKDDNSYDVNIQTCCISKNSPDTKSEHNCGEESEQTCGVKISGTKFQVTMSTSCCDEEESDCEDETQQGTTAGSTSSSSDTGTLAGGIVGGLLGGVVITVVVVVVWWSCRRRRQRSDEANPRQTYSGPSKTKTQPIVVPDVIKMSSSGLDVDYHEYHVISESQNRKPETGDYVDIRDEDLRGENPGYEVAGRLAEVSSSQVEIKEQKSVKGKKSTGRMDSNVNDDEYNRLGDGCDRANRGTDYDKIGESGGLGPDIAADYFVLEDQGKQEKPTGRHDPNDNGEDYNRLGDSNNRPRRGADYDKIGENDDPRQNLSADYFVLEDQGKQEKPTGRHDQNDNDDDYNRLGDGNNRPSRVTNYDKIGESHRREPDLATDYFVLEEQGDQEQYNRLGAPVLTLAGQDTYNRLGEELEHGADDTVDIQDNKPGDIQPSNEGSTYNRLGQDSPGRSTKSGDTPANEEAVGDIYNRHGQASTDVMTDKQDHKVRDYFFD